MRSASSKKSIRQESGGLSNTPPIEPIWPLQRRVDWLTIAFCLVLNEQHVEQITSGVPSAGRTGKPVDTGGVSFVIKSSRAEDRFTWENGDARGLFDLRAAGGWYLEVTLRSQFLALHSIEDSIELAKRISRVFGDQLNARVRRIDLCADFANWCIGEVSHLAWIAQRRARVSAFEQQTHRVGTRITGFIVCPGNPLLMRAYDKVVELNVAGREQKREIEYALWKKNGWQSEPVTRIEFQIKSDVLRAFDMRNPDALVGKLDGLWAYCTKEWVRLAIPNSASRRTRWKIDPRWLVVRSVCFKSISPSLVRRPVSSGASPEQVVGNIRGFLAARGRMSPLVSLCEGGCQVCESHHVFMQLPESEAIDIVNTIVEDYLHAVRTDLVNGLIIKYGPQNAAYRLCIQHDAACAKFRTTDSFSCSIEKKITEMNNEEE